jgi:ATP-dependent Clp protease ATP-binding subunit ClpC
MYEIRTILGVQTTNDFHRVMELANSEAQRFDHEYIGTEHVLLALTKPGYGIAVNVLRKLDVDVQKVRLELENSMKSGPHKVHMGKLPQTPETKNVIGYAMEEARNLNHRCVGTQHILLGLLREQKGVAALWNTLGVTLEEARAEVSQMSEEDERPLFSPNDPDQDVRHAIKSCWAALPEEVRNVNEVERQVHRIVDRALRDFRDDFEEFSRTKSSD